METPSENQHGSVDIWNVVKYWFSRGEIALFLKRCSGCNRGFPRKMHKAYCWPVHTLLVECLNCCICWYASTRGKIMGKFPFFLLKWANNLPILRKNGNILGKIQNVPMIFPSEMCRWRHYFLYQMQKL